MAIFHVQNDSQRTAHSGISHENNINNEKNPITVNNTESDVYNMYNKYYVHTKKSFIYKFICMHQSKTMDVNKKLVDLGVELFSGMKV